jgi:anthranilate phosphoribosyltransferase
MHGKTSKITHASQGLFLNVPSPFTATRYHSLIVQAPLPDELEAMAYTEEGELMALRHRTLPIFGVQFHPESILTNDGKTILRNFLDIKAAAEVTKPVEKENDMLKSFIAKLIRHEDLESDQAQEAMTIIMTGQATPAQIGGYLVALRMKGETVEEITGSVRAMRAQATRVPFHANGNALLDTAGTGGDGAHSFNISTAAAFVIAGTGRKVAKHGNRAASSNCGSADVLSELGISLELTPEQVAECIETAGIGFMFAPKFHPAMKYAVPVRKELGQRTIFNLLGPLTNPAGATHQLVGVYDPALTKPLAEVLGELGSRAALVIHGHGGMDELTTSGPNRVSQLKDGQVTTYDLNPAEFGLRAATKEDLRGGSPSENAARMRDLLSGQDQSACKDVVLLNAAAAISTTLGDFRQSLAEARNSLESGAALAKLNELVGLSRKFALAV